MTDVLHADFTRACMTHIYSEEQFYEELLECVRDTAEECINTRHFTVRSGERRVSRADGRALSKDGRLDRWEKGRNGTAKLYLQHRTPRGRLLEGVFVTDGRDLYGITVYEVPQLRLAA